MAKQIVGTGYRIIDRTGEYLRSAETATERAIAAGGVLVQQEAKRLLNQQGYPPASLPGDPPAKRTGTLGRSIDTETVDRSKAGGFFSRLFRSSASNFVARVGTNVKYGFWLELGTRKMAARPFLRPALRSQGSRIVELLKRSYRGVR